MRHNSYSHTITFIHERCNVFSSFSFHNRWLFFPVFHTPQGVKRQRYSLERNKKTNVINTFFFRQTQNISSAWWLFNNFFFCFSNNLKSILQIKMKLWFISTVMCTVVKCPHSVCTAHIEISQFIIWINHERSTSSKIPFKTFNEISLFHRVIDRWKKTTKIPDQISVDNRNSRFQIICILSFILPKVMWFSDTKCVKCQFMWNQWIVVLSRKIWANYQKRKFWIVSGWMWWWVDVFPFF